MRKRLITGIAAIGMAVCLLSYVTAQQTTQQSDMTVELKNGAGESVGAVTIQPVANGKHVRLKLALTNLAPGMHAIHFHEMAKCEGPTFETAGAHFNPTTKMHGLKNPKGPHAGDMNNFTVKPDGTANGTIVNQHVTLAAGANSLFTNGGTALVIHAQPDDQKTDPSGNSGDRIACGVISK